MTKQGYDEKSAFWAPVEPTAGIPAEARWNLVEAQTNPRVKKELVVVVFAELSQKAVDNLEAFIEFVARSTDQYSLPDHIMDRLESEIDAGKEERGPLLITLLSRPESVESPYWRVVAVGPPQARIFRRDGFTRGKPLHVKTGCLSNTPVVGIIDDSIGFLHHRFRRTDRSTRFEALWLMHSDTLAGDPGPCTGPATLFGIELTKADINLRLASGHSEESLYRQVNNGIFGAGTRHGTAFHAGHGTHVLDLAAGAEPGEDMAEVPILGVQLSPSSIGETSGAALDPDVTRGLEWIVTRALQMPGRFPLVINLSLGSLAGPQNGTSLVETWIASLILRYHYFSGQAPIRVVVAYGNAWRARLVAEPKIGPGQTVTVDWRVLPDDATKSVLELRTQHGKAAAIDLRVTPPDGGPDLARPLWRGSGLIDQYVTSRGIAAEAADIAEIGSDTAMVTVAPTIRFDNRPTANSGNWRIALTNNGTKSVSVRLKVQRDDTPGGYRRTGRQSWLDHPDAYAYEDATRAYTLPSPAGPITRRGTEVSYAGFDHQSVYFVGAARPDPMAPDPATFKEKLRPAIYAAQGALPKPATATLSALGDEGSVLRGLRAAGNLTGSTARLSGSSMAAPQITRRLLELAMAGALTAQPGIGAPPLPAEVQAVLQRPPLAVADGQLGRGTVFA
ncbi:MAG: S8 family serine peptidase [Paracoccaceae bacterium]